MTWSAARIYLGGIAVLIAIVWSGPPIHLPHDVHRGFVSEIVACDAATAIVEWRGPGGAAVSRTATDGRELWIRNIPGEPELRALHVSSDAVYVRYSKDGMDGDRWIERIDLDGSVRWRHLLARSGDRVSFEDIEEPIIVGNALIEAVWAADHHEWRAFDTRTGWPLWRIDVGLGFDRVDVTGTRVVVLDHERLLAVDTVTGRTTITEGLGDGCMLRDELFVVRPGEKHDRIIGLPQLDLEKRRLVSVLSTRDDRHHVTELHGCASYGERKIFVMRTFAEGRVESALREIASDGSTLLEKQLPSLEAAVRTPGMWTMPAVVTSTVPRFIAVGLGDDMHTSSSVGVVDLETGELVRSSQPLEEVQIQRAGSLWFATAYVRAKRSFVIVVIDGTTGRLSGSAADAPFSFEVTQVAAGTLWIKTGDDTGLISLDARSLRPTGFRAHVLAATVRSSLRPLDADERALVGL